MKIPSYTIVISFITRINVSQNKKQKNFIKPMGLVGIIQAPSAPYFYIFFKTTGLIVISAGLSPVSAGFTKLRLEKIS
jgi:hypothetical protein